MIDTIPIARVAVGKLGESVFELMFLASLKN
jgi:hypothetical protein